MMVMPFDREEDRIDNLLETEGYPCFEFDEARPAVPHAGLVFPVTGKMENYCYGDGVEVGSEPTLVSMDSYDANGLSTDAPPPQEAVVTFAASTLESAQAPNRPRAATHPSTPEKMHTVLSLHSMKTRGKRRHRSFGGDESNYDCPEDATPKRPTLAIAGLLRTAVPKRRARKVVLEPTGDTTGGSVGPSEKSKKNGRNLSLSEARWLLEREKDPDFLPLERPVGISIASGSSTGWRIRVAGAQLGHYATAREAYEAYTACTQRQQVEQAPAPSSPPPHQDHLGGRGGDDGDDGAKSHGMHHVPILPDFQATHNAFATDTGPPYLFGEF